MAEKKTAAKAEAPKTAKKAVKTEAKAQPRLKALYNNEFKAKLQKDLGLDNINQVPELKKVIVSCGVGKKREDKKFTETVALTIAKLPARHQLHVWQKNLSRHLKFVKAWVRQ